MKEASDKPFDPRMLDLHLGHLSQAERAELLAGLAEDARLADQHQRLSAVFAALQSVPEQMAPADLAARTMARVRAAGTPPRVVRPADDLTRRLERQPERVIRIGQFRDIIGIAALIMLAIGVGVPGMLRMRDQAQRIGCSRNLQQLGMGVQQYANVFGASLPFVGWEPDQSWRPSADPEVNTVFNRRHVYPLLRLAYVRDPQAFVCPSRHDVAMPSELVPDRDDFVESRNVSYAYQNMAGVRPVVTNAPADLPILADDNPLFADGTPLFDMRRLHWGDPATSNSDAHGQAGQNLLTLDGRVIWAKTPNCGVNGDNVWTLQNVDDYTGHEGPHEATDTHLLK